MKGNERTGTQMNEPTRLRMICLRHLKNANSEIGSDKIDALEEDIKAFVQSVIHGAEELGLDVVMSNSLFNFEE